MITEEELNQLAAQYDWRAWVVPLREELLHVCEGSDGCMCMYFEPYMWWYGLNTRSRYLDPSFHVMRKWEDIVPLAIALSKTNIGKDSFKAHLSYTKGATHG